MTFLVDSSTSAFTQASVMDGPTTWMPIAVAVAVVTFGVGLFAAVSAAAARRRAPRGLALARAALAMHLPDRARRLLPDAFYMPIRGRYRPQDASTALDVLDAFEDAMASYKLNGKVITRDLRAALEQCVISGAPVPWRLISAFSRVLWATAPRGAPLLRIVREETERAEGLARGEDGGPHRAQIIRQALAPRPLGAPRGWRPADKRAPSAA